MTELAVPLKLCLQGTPPSLNAIVDPWRSQREHAAPWQERIAECLRDREAPCEPALVAAKLFLTFDDRRRRSADDLYPILARALGDALFAEGWIADRGDLVIDGPSIRSGKHRRTRIVLEVGS